MNASLSLKNKPYRIVILITGLVTLVLGILIFIVPPSPFPDPSWGFQVMRCMQQGHPFNLLLSPNPDNIALDDADFLSWWSPGQYLMPYFLKTILWLNTGKAVALTVSLCSVLGLAGYYQLFKRLGFTPWISAISMAFIASQNFFILPHIFYTGGETLLFAFAGWFLYGCFGVNKLNWQALLFVLCAGLVGFFAKSSALWMYAAGVACIWINVSFGQKDILKWVKNGVLLAIPFISAIAIIYLFYLSKGQNPSNAGGPLLIKPETFSFPLASPLLAGLSLDELFNGFIYHPDGAMFSYQWTTVILIVIALSALALVIAVYRYVPERRYAIALIAFYVIGNVFFTYLYLKQAAVSFEGRHYRIIGLLAIPGIVYLVSKAKISRIAFGIVWIAFICWEFKTFKTEFNYNRHASHGISGLSQQAYVQSTLDELSALDAQHPNQAIFVIPSPDIAIELPHNRIITLDIEDMTSQEFAELKYAGNGGIIYILMPVSYEKNGTAKGICKSFVNYHHFEVKPLDKDYRLYTAIN